MGACPEVVSLTRLRRRQALLFIGLLIFLAFFTVSLAAILSVPTELHLYQGEIRRLQVGFPLRLFAPAEAKSFLAGSMAQGSELVFRSASTGKINIQLKLLGIVPLRRVNVTVLPERKVVPSGQAIGVLLAEDGVIVVGFQALRDMEGRQHNPAKDAGVALGDVILSVNDQPVHHAEDLAKLVREAGEQNLPARLWLRRAGRHLSCPVIPVRSRGAEGGPQESRPMLGLYVEDPAAGVGTMTFYDPDTKAFAALGHRITELGGQHHVWLEGGKIVAARISGIELGQRGDPGEKLGTFSGPEDIIGTIQSNSRFGLYGRLGEVPPAGDRVPVALAHQVHPGPARILTVVQGTEVQSFEVEVIRVYRQSRPRDKGMVLKVVDPRLLALTGGIIQGMSGSPIIQDGRLIGSITHVFVNDPTRGYGVLAEWMLQEMDAVNRMKAA